MPSKALLLLASLPHLALALLGGKRWFANLLTSFRQGLVQPEAFDDGVQAFNAYTLPVLGNGVVTELSPSLSELMGKQYRPDGQPLPGYWTSGEAIVRCWTSSRIGKSATRSSVEHAGARRVSLAQAGSRQEELSELGKSITPVCLGGNSSSQECFARVTDLRRGIWPTLLAQLVNLTTFDDVRRTKAPSVRQFRMGGGILADIPCRSDAGKEQLYYRHVHNAHGPGIKEKLGLNAKQSDDDRWRKRGLCHKYKTDREELRQPLLFTFVRHPIDKFIDGYQEMVSSGTLMAIGSHGVGTVEHAMDFLRNVFSGTCDNGGVLLNIQTFLGPPCESRFNFVGKVERFDKDWDQLGQMAGCSGGAALKNVQKVQGKSEAMFTNTPSASVDEDDISVDERLFLAAEARKAMRSALAQHDFTLLKALCLWMLPDFIAFDYDLPPGCQDHTLLKSLVR